jgi:hypothetical protein
MGWDYITYNAQPAFFIEEIAVFMEAEDKAKQIINAQSNGGTNTTGRGAKAQR